MPDLLERVRQAAADLRDAEEATRARRELRDRLVVAAVDEGVQQRAVARAAGISNGRVIQLIAERY